MKNEELKNECDLNTSIIRIRAAISKEKILKSGTNNAGTWGFFELKDFLPTLNELMYQEKINDRFYIKGSEAILELIKGTERQEYTIPFVRFETPVTKNGTQTMQDIQYLGALCTYYRRYLYIAAFGITDGDIINSISVEDVQKKDTSKVKITPRQCEILSSIYKGENMTKLLESNQIEKLEDMTLNQASEIIKKLEKINKNIVQ